jgi:dUTP pyrophosphatase
VSVVNIKAAADTAVIPQYQTKGAVAFDFHCSRTIWIPPKSYGMVHSDLVIKVPENTALLCLPRSSTFKKTGLLFVTSGLIDQDYCGPEDVISFMMYNTTEDVVKVEVGDRLVQGLFVGVTAPVEFVESDMTEANRGGYGSTGV